MSWSRRLTQILAPLGLGAGLATGASAATVALPAALASLSPTWGDARAGVWEGKTEAADPLVVRRLAEDAVIDDAAGAKAAIAPSASPLADPGVPGVGVWLFRVAQTPSGLTYVGVRRLSLDGAPWQVEVTCREQGTTGVREAVLLDRALGDGSVSFEGGALTWRVPPDDPRYDAEFPTHPLSRCRKVLGALAGG